MSFCCLPKSLQRAAAESSATIPWKGSCPALNFPLIFSWPAWLNSWKKVFSSGVARAISLDLNQKPWIINQQFSLWNLPIIFNKYRSLLMWYFYDKLQAISEKWEFLRNSTKSKVVNYRQKITTIWYIAEYLIMRIAVIDNWQLTVENW